MKTKKQYNLEDKLNFGKYRHLSLRTVIDRDAEYVLWCISKIPDFTLSDEAWNYATERNESFVAVRPKPTYSSKPYSDGVEVLTTFPWKDRYLTYLRTHAEDAQIVIPTPHQTQLTIW